MRAGMTAEGLRRVRSDAVEETRDDHERGAYVVGSAEQRGFVTSESAYGEFVGAARSGAGRDEDRGAFAKVPIDCVGAVHSHAYFEAEVRAMSPQRWRKPIGARRADAEVVVGGAVPTTNSTSS